MEHYHSEIIILFYNQNIYLKIALEINFLTLFIEVSKEQIDINVSFFSTLHLFSLR